MNHSISK